MFGNGSLWRFFDSNWLILGLLSQLCNLLKDCCTDLFLSIFWNIFLKFLWTHQSFRFYHVSQMILNQLPRFRFTILLDGLETWKFKHSPEPDDNAHKTKKQKIIQLRRNFEYTTVFKTDWKVKITPLFLSAEFGYSVFVCSVYRPSTSYLPIIIWL